MPQYETNIAASYWHPPLPASGRGRGLGRISPTPRRCNGTLPFPPREAGAPWAVGGQVASTTRRTVVSLPKMSTTLTTTVYVPGAA